MPDPPKLAERTVLQAPRFPKQKRRLPTKAQLAVDEAVRGIAADPLSGELKTGALKGVRVLLLAYELGRIRALAGTFSDARLQASVPAVDS